MLLSRLIDEQLVRKDKAILRCRTGVDIGMSSDINPKDYRAWYGLGQTYELLDMPEYAIQYYNRATALR
jgi:hypothetical protein